MGLARFDERHARAVHQRCRRRRTPKPISTSSPQSADAGTLAHGIAEVMRSDETPPFAQIVSAVVRQRVERSEVRR